MALQHRFYMRFTALMAARFLGLGALGGAGLGSHASGAYIFDAHTGSDFRSTSNQLLACRDRKKRWHATFSRHGSAEGPCGALASSLLRLGPGRPAPCVLRQPW